MNFHHFESIFFINGMKYQASKFILRKAFTGSCMLIRTHIKPQKFAQKNQTLTKHSNLP